MTTENTLSGVPCADVFKVQSFWQVRGLCLVVVTVPFQLAGWFVIGGTRGMRGDKKAGQWHDHRMGYEYCIEGLH
jgi:hypothetical protein